MARIENPKSDKKTNDNRKKLLICETCSHIAINFESDFSYS